MQRSNVETKRFSGRIPMNSDGVWKNHITTQVTNFESQVCVCGVHTEIRHRGNTVLTANGRMEDEPPTQSMLQLFNRMHPGRHLSSWSCMRSLLHTLELHVLPLPGLRIKTCLSHSFEIIIKYYSQGLKPLRLAPLFNLSSPFPLPTLWKLSPPSLFLHGRSAHNDVYILY
jgi:hypothetical protein